MITRAQVVGFFLCLFLLALIGVVGEMDKVDAQQDAALYCKMVAANKWPDFRHTYAFDCPQAR